MARGLAEVVEGLRFCVPVLMRLGWRFRDRPVWVHGYIHEWEGAVLGGGVGLVSLTSYLDMF